MRRLNDQIEDQTFAMPAAYGNVSKSGNALADGVLSGFGWRGGAITFSFPDAASDYGYNVEPSHNFHAIAAEAQQAVRKFMERDAGIAADDGFSVEGFTRLQITERTGDDDARGVIRYAESSSANPSAYAYYPGNGERSGDVWLGRQGDDSLYPDADVGTYEYMTLMHETGHALGLKHGHQATKHDKIQTELKGQFDSLEYSVMTYHSYAGSKEGFYTNEDFGYPQSYMMADIAALQHIYGANFTVNNDDTVYSWSPDSGNTVVKNGVNAAAAGINMDALREGVGVNKIFATIWDGRGHDSYDLSAYTDGVLIDLRPGKSSLFSDAQLADLDTNHSGGLAGGNIYNALLYKGKQASLIEDAIGGAGNDRLVGNAADNTLTGNAGDDTFVFAKNSNHDTIADFGNGADVIDLTSFDIKNFAKLEARMTVGDTIVVVDFGKGDVLTIESANHISFTSDNFLF